MNVRPKSWSDQKNYEYVIPYTSYDSLGILRRARLLEYAAYDENDFKIAFRDPKTNVWTKWQSVYKVENDDLFEAYDIHRSVIFNEVVVESDYPSYNDNVDAAQLVGAVLERKGFKPAYYYSGGKSIHIHFFFDFSCFNSISVQLQELILTSYTRNMFIKKFMLWLRAKAISMWGVSAREFDTDLVRSSHLIRSELSMNKHGWKTYLGSSYKDVKDLPELCNAENGFKPKLGPFELSRPNDPEALIKDFLAAEAEKANKRRVKRKEQSLMKWVEGPTSISELRPSVKFLLSSDFTDVAVDGRHRAMFIIANEVKQVYGELEALRLLKEWNDRMGSPVREQEIDYRIKSEKVYSLPDEYIDEFIRTIKDIVPNADEDKRIPVPKLN